MPSAAQLIAHSADRFVIPARSVATESQLALQDALKQRGRQLA